MTGEEDIVGYVAVVAVVIGFMYFAWLIIKKKINGKKLTLEDVIEGGKEMMEHKDEIQEIGESIVQGDKEALKDKVVEHKDDILNEVEDIIEDINSKGD